MGDLQVRKLQRPLPPGLEEDEEGKLRKK